MHEVLPLHALFTHRVEVRVLDLKCISCVRGMVGCVEELMNGLMRGDEADASVGEPD